MPPPVRARDTSPFKNSFLSPTPPNLTSACHYGDLELAPTVARKQDKKPASLDGVCGHACVRACVLQVSILLEIQYKPILISTP